MKNGQCPKCGSATICSRTDGVYFYRSSLFVDTGKKELIPMNVHYVSYLCTTCGYFETYVANPG